MDEDSHESITIVMTVWTVAVKWNICAIAEMTSFMYHTEDTFAQQ